MCVYMGVVCGACVSWVWVDVLCISCVCICVSVCISRHEIALAPSVGEGIKGKGAIYRIPVPALPMNQSIFFNPLSKSLKRSSTQPRVPV